MMLQDFSNFLIAFQQVQYGCMGQDNRIGLENLTLKFSFNYA